MTWGVNFGLDNVTNAVNMAKSIIKAFGSAAVKQAQVTLDLMEVGMCLFSENAPQLDLCSSVMINNDGFRE